MPTRRIGNLPAIDSMCRAKDHDPDPNIVLPPGLYEHECSKCGRVIKFTIEGSYYSDNKISNGDQPDKDK